MFTIIISKMRYFITFIVHIYYYLTWWVLLQNNLFIYSLTKFASENNRDCAAHQRSYAQNARMRTCGILEVKEKGLAFILISDRHENGCAVVKLWHLWRSLYKLLFNTTNKVTQDSTTNYTILQLCVRYIYLCSPRTLFTL